jgi:hypothetical protein
MGRPNYRCFNRWVNGCGGTLLEVTMSKETDVAAILQNCRALINQIIAGLSAEKPFVTVSSAAELLLYLECAASALNKAVPRQ